MSRLIQIESYRKHLESRYYHLLEMSSAYKFIDESKSDSAAYKAMKIRTKLDKIHYLDGDFSYS